MSKGLKQSMRVFVEEQSKEIEKTADFVYKLEDAVTCGMFKKAREVLKEYLNIDKTLVEARESVGLMLKEVQNT